MTDRLAFADGNGAWGVGRGAEPMVEYVAEVARPVGASDGVWLTGHPRHLRHPRHPRMDTNTRMPEAETGSGSGWRVVLVGALLVGGLWGVAVAWTLLALVRAL